MSEPRLLSSLLLDAGFVFSLFLLGWLVASWVDPGGDKMFRTAVAFPLGAGLLTIAMFALSLLGVPLSRGLTLAVLGAPIAVLGLVRVLRSARRPEQSSSETRPANDGRLSWEWPALIAIALLFGASLVVSIGRSYSTWDAAAIWGVKGYGIALQKTIWAASDWGAYGLSYPLNLPLQISAFASLDGDVVPGSKLIFPLYYGSLAIGLLAYLRQEGSTMSGWAVVFVMALPIAFDHATQGYANLPFATYIVLGTLLAIQAASSGRKGTPAVSGIAFGLAVWTRPEGLVLVGAAFAALMLGARARGVRWKPGWAWVLPSLVIGGGWLAFSLANGETGPLQDMVSSATASLSAGQWNPSAFYWIGRYLARDMLRPSTWGLFLPVVAVGVILHVRRSRGRPQVRQWMLLGTALATGSLILGFYYLISFSGDLEWWLDTGLSRMLLPSALLLAVWAVAPWTEPREFA